MACITSQQLCTTDLVVEPSKPVASSPILLLTVYITTRGLYLPTGQEVQDLKLLVESQVHCVTNNREQVLSHDQRVEFPS